VRRNELTHGADELDMILHPARIAVSRESPAGGNVLRIIQIALDDCSQFCYVCDA
jgi:hypothetical protein